MKKKILLAACFLCLCFMNAVVAQTTIYVDSSANGKNNGKSWKNAFTSLTPAMMQANSLSGSVKIKVAKGTYYPSNADGTSTTSRDSSFRFLRDSINLSGGFPAGGGDQDIKSNPAILSGDIGIKANNTDNSYHIIIIGTPNLTQDVTAETILDGLIITNGNSDSYGSGITYIMPQFANEYLKFTPVIQNCSFENNIASSYGGAIYFGFGGSEHAFYTLRPSFTNCSFKSNSSYYGGAISIGNSGCSESAVFTNCSFEANTAAFGGAYYSTTNYYFTYNYDTFISCTFSKNQADNDGAALYAYSFYGIIFLTLNDCKLNKNSASQNGGAIYCGSLGGGWLTAAITNSIFFRNAAEYGGGMYQIANSGSNTTSNYLNCVFSDNAADYGGGIYFVFKPFTFCNPTLTNCLFCNNTSNLTGGALSFYVAPDNYNGHPIKTTYISPVITNGTFYNNTANSDTGNTIYADFENNHVRDTVKINNSIIWENSVYGKNKKTVLNQNTAVFLLTNSLLQGGISPGTISSGNTSSLRNKYPKFSDTVNLVGNDGIWATSDDGLALKNKSFAINKGNNVLLLTTDTTDITGAPRIQCDTVDLGAYERQCNSLSITNSNSESNLKTTLALNTYPNPAHNILTISFTNYSSKAHISIYDISGKRLIAATAEIISGNTTTLNIAPLKPGVYLLIADVNGQLVKEKFVKE